ncbi:transcriptional regulatory protein TcrA [Phytohabitans rumicis]|uniref:Transcriptional regulatory protein TcrA n=2 Tax=Phytohabitans rumicis TaxID=1076125 RepID=A0A6V8LC52_9ACTN|nr:transcriptional regulatory protein TcrA [Phytohabitans rumicis]
MRLLVVEDDPAMSALLVRGLERIGYVIDAVDNGPDALWSIFENGYDAVVLDAMIPPPDGFEVCRRMRAEGRWEPVLLVTARDAVPDRVRGLDAGADDYLMKPFTFAELYARLRAIIRRHPHARPAILQIGDLTLDPVSKVVRRSATRIALSPREFALLEAFMRRPGELLSPADLVDDVWDLALDGPELVGTYVRYLRDKVDRPFGRHSIEALTDLGGYRLDPEA